MALLLLVVVLAVVGGFVGDLLKLALWAVVILAAVGAALAFLVYRWFERVKDRFF